MAAEYNVNRLETRREGYWSIPSGECQQIKRKVLRVDAGFAIHGAKKDEVVRWLRGWGKEWDFERNETLGWLQGPPDPERSVSPADYDKLSGETLPWETAETRCVARSPFAYTRSPETGREERCSHRAPFLKLPDSFKRDGWSTVWLTRGGRYVTLEVCNLAPYTISSALHYQSKRKEWNTEGSWSLDAGACESFERNFQGVDPRFYVHASADGEVVRWLHHDAVVLSGAESAAACLGKAETAALGERSDLQDCGAGEELQDFTEVPHSFENSDREVYMVHLDTRDIPLPTAEDGDIDLGAAREKIQEIAKLLPQRLRHQRKWTSDIPYTFSVAVLDENLDFQLGVAVTQTQGQTPFGVEIPFRPGDVLVEFEGQP
ncbi:MAG: DUF1036 domain-containing protein, partial [Thermoanaerobaculia bacterium]